MSVKYGFFNAVDGDRTYDADSMSEYFKGLVSDGVYESVGGALQVLAGSGLVVNVQTGRAIIDCKWMELDAVEAVTISEANSVLNRYTAVVARLDVTEREMVIDTVDGTPASSPTKPSITYNSSIKEICLAMVYVPAGATAITQANITDTRASSLCGWVTGLIKQVNTADLFLQWQTAYQAYYDAMTAQFEAWFESLTQQLNVNTFIKHFDKVSTLDGSITSVSLNMTGYTYSPSDIVNVYINGLYATAGTDYNLSVSGDTATITDLPAVDGTVINIQVLRSQIGFYVIAASDAEGLEAGENEGVLA